MMKELTTTNTFLVVLFCFALLSGSGCDQSIEVPSYLQIDNYTVTTDPSTQGSNSHNIQDVWVYANGNLIGAFNLPATIPILETGLTDIIVDPGIRENGLVGSPQIYPYYTRFQTEIELVEGESVAITPVSSYVSDAQMPFIEDFEESNFFVNDRDEDEETKVIISAVGAFDGFAGRIELTTDHPTIEVGASFFLEDLPTDGSSAVYLEMDYKNEIFIGLGLVAVDDTGQEQAFYSHVLNPKGEWNKVYINLSELLFNTKAEKYQVAFAATLPDDLENATILLDNIKLVYR